MAAVADPSLGLDRRFKVRGMLAPALADYWIVDLVGAHREPEPDAAHGCGDWSVEMPRRSARVRPLAAPATAISVAGLLL